MSDTIAWARGSRLLVIVAVCLAANGCRRDDSRVSVMSAGVMSGNTSAEGAITKSPEFPMPAAELEKLKADSGMDAKRRLRDHAWLLYRMTIAGSNGECCPEPPDWITWKTKLETLSKKATDSPWMWSNEPRMIPLERSTTLEAGGSSDNGQTSKESRSVFSNVHFNRDAAFAIGKYVNQGKSGLGLKSRCAPNSNGCSANSFDPLADVKTALVVKPIWLVVPNNGELLLPVWDFDPAPDGSDGLPFEKWRNYVSVLGDKQKCDDAKSKQEISVAVQPQKDILRDRLEKKGHVCIDEFFFRTIDNYEDVSAIVATHPPMSQGIAVAGKSTAILVGMHIISKEIPSWTWNTFWWMPAGLRDSSAAAKGRPRLPAPWSNYVMNTTLTAAVRGTKGDYHANPMYNPYQEALLPADASGKGGLASNCLACHQQASFDVDAGRAAAPQIAPSHPPRNTSASMRMLTGFLWSIAKMEENK